MYLGDEIEEKLKIYNHVGDRCVCGVSVLAIGFDRYCQKCYEKRELFTNEIIGHIDLDLAYRIAGFQPREIAVIEKLRQFGIRREIYGLIDIHFSEYNSYNGKYCEPYNNPSFLSLVNKKKSIFTYAFLGELCEHNLTMTERSNINFPREKNDKFNGAFGQYLVQVDRQLKNDSRNIWRLSNAAASLEPDSEEVRGLVMKYRTKYGI